MARPEPTAAFRRACLAWMPRLVADLDVDELDAAAILGNAGHESAGLTLMQELRPTVPGSRGGLGAFQWTGPRRRAFEAWLARTGAPASDLDASYAFLLRELKGPEKRSVAATKAAAGLKAKVEAFERTYERAGVKHYPSRLAWARIALDIHRSEDRRDAPAPPPRFAARRATSEPRAAPGSWWERLLGVQEPTPAAVGRNRGDETLFRAQNRLLAAGYTEVGDPDGLWGPNTKAAIDSLLREQFPGVAPPPGWPLADDVLAALAKARRREVSAERAGVTVGTLLASGSTPIKAPVQLVGGGGLIGILGLGKALEESGIAAHVTAVSDQASTILGSVQAAIGMVGGAASLLLRFWWVLLVGLGLFWIAKGAKWALEIRALARQGSIRQTSL